MDCFTLLTNTTSSHLDYEVSRNDNSTLNIKISTLMKLVDYGNIQGWLKKDPLATVNQRSARLFHKVTRDLQ